jgi:hypothetical protein
MVLSHNGTIFSQTDILEAAIAAWLDAAGYGRRVDTPHQNPEIEEKKQRQAEEKKQKAMQFLRPVLDAIPQKAELRGERTRNVIQWYRTELIAALLQYYKNKAWQTKDISTLTDSIVQWASSYEGGVLTNDVKLNIQKMIDAHAKSSLTAKNKLRKELANTLDAPEILAETKHLRLMNLVSRTHLQQETAELGHCVWLDDEWPNGGSHLETHMEKIKNGSMKVFGIRKKQDGEWNIADDGVPYRTIEYDTASHTISQIKTKDNDLLTRDHPHYPEVLEMIGGIADHYPVDHIEELDDVVESLPPQTWLTTKGERTASQLRAGERILWWSAIYVANGNSTLEEIQTCMSLSYLTCDLTHASASIKEQLEMLEGVCLDTSNLLDLYRSITRIDGYLTCLHLTKDTIAKTFPSLQYIQNPLLWDDKTVVIWPDPITHKPQLLTKEMLPDYERDEKIRKAEAIQFLYQNNMVTPENIAMINAVKYTAESIEIGGVAWARENLTAQQAGMEATHDSSNNKADYNKPHVFSWEWQYASENYFTRAAIEEIQKKGEISLPTYDDMRRTLVALPWWPTKSTPPSDPESTDFTTWSAALYTILMWCQKSGYRSSGSFNDTDRSGSLWSASPRNNFSAWAFGWDSTKGFLYDDNRKDAFPCRPLAKHSSSTSKP